MHASQFLTNVFFIPYMALRESDGGKPNTASNGCNPSALPSYAPALGVVAAIVGVVTFFWVPLALPQFGGLTDRSAPAQLLLLYVFLQIPFHVCDYAGHVEDACGMMCLFNQLIWPHAQSLHVQVGVLPGGIQPEQSLFCIHPGCRPL